MPTPVDFVGTVSKNSMDENDLIRTFVALLDYYWPEKAEDFRWEFSEVFESLVNPNHWNRPNHRDYICWNPPAEIMAIAAHLIYGKLWDALDELAPAGYKFCENPKDFTDFGYWEEKDE